MKKLLSTLLVLVATFISFTGNAQQLSTGDKIVNLGIGASSGYGGYSGLPLNASYEVFIKDEISVGGQLGYVTNKYYSLFYVGGRGAYHVNKVLNLDIDKLDLYGGLSLGYTGFNWKDDFAGLGTYGGIGFGGFIGGRYFLNEKFAGYLELGAGGLGYANLGISIKLK
jgi:hypothetical protein